MADSKKNPEKKKSGLVKFLKETVIELKKVIWPTKKQLIVNTTVVIVASKVVSLFVSGVDFGLVQLVNVVLFKK
jgi:preprotein translocase subunit SecE